jgi:hypothetical protein
MKDGVNPRGDARRSARLVRLAERTSFVVGAVCLTLYCAACVHSSMSQSKEQRAFDRALAQIMLTEAHDQSEWSRERVEKYEESRAIDVEALGRLDIPDAGVSVMVLEGTDDWTLNRAVGRIEGVASRARPGRARRAIWESRGTATASSADCDTWTWATSSRSRPSTVSAVIGSSTCRWWTRNR